MGNYILMIAAIILLCLSLNRVLNRLGIPMLLAFIVLGMLFGTDGILKISFDDYNAAQHICTISLIFIMFYGGFGTNIKQAKPVIVPAMFLSTAGVIITAVVVGFFCHYLLHIDFMESMLIGAVVSSTDAASVFSILRSKRLNLKYNTASMLEIESGSNDPFAYMLTIIILNIMQGDFSASDLFVMLFKQLFLGILTGVAVAYISAWLLKRVSFSVDGFDTIFVFSISMVAYAGAEMAGGNGYLSTYIAGIILGNVKLKNKKSMVNFFDGVTGLVQILIFFLLGLLSYPSRMLEIMPYGLLIALVLTFIARPLAVGIILTPFRCPLKQQILVAWSGLRGAASIVFAIIATVSPAYTKNDLFHIVIFIVLFSISIQGTLLGGVAKKMDMMDEESNVLMTFSDYSDEMPVDFIKISVSENHPWADKAVKDITSLPDLLMVLILRGDKKIIPNGNTVIYPNDKIIMSALSPEENLGIYLSEIQVEKENKWIGRTLSRIKIGENQLVILLKRGDKVLIPNGDTVIQKDDILVISG